MIVFGYTGDDHFFYQKCSYTGLFSFLPIDGSLENYTNFAFIINGSIAD
jgi:hypothetical protein